MVQENKVVPKQVHLKEKIKLQRQIPVQAMLMKEVQQYQEQGQGLQSLKDQQLI